MTSYLERQLTRGIYKGETLTGHTIHTASLRPKPPAPSEVGLYTCTTEFGSQLNKPPRKGLYQQGS